MKIKISYFVSIKHIKKHYKVNSLAQKNRNRNKWSIETSKRKKPRQWLKNRLILSKEINNLIEIEWFRKLFKILLKVTSVRDL